MAAELDPVVRLKQLNEKASNFTLDNKIPVIRYLRSTKEMERMAFVYSSENEYESGFLLYMKMITLLVEKLPKHPHYKTLKSEQRQTIKKRCALAFKTAEKLKQALKVQYQNEYDKWLLQEEERKKQEEEKKKFEEAEALKRREKSQQPSAPIIFPDVPSTAVTTTPSIDTSISFSSYPSSLPGTASQNDRVQPSAPPASNTETPIQPFTPQQLPPSYDQAINFNSYPVNQVDATIPGQVPQIDRTTKPSQLTIPETNQDHKPQDIFRQDSTSLDGNRRVIISSDLAPKFLELAANNTGKNLETCGILTGKLSRNMFRVTHIVIPKQSATPDSCATESEEELFDVQDKYDLITLGWIHTHPSQTSFLSSVDLHTQCSYQQLMPEAIAIVCAPKYKTTGIYRLTPSHGLKFISSCTQSGFHPHPKEPPLFEDSPLVSVENSYSTEVIDLR